MPKTIFQTSLLFHSCRIFYNKYLFLRRLVSSALINSRCRMLAASLRSNIMTAFRYSFFGRSTDIASSSNAQDILGESKFLSKLKACYWNCRLWLNEEFKRSLLRDLAGRTRERFYLLPLRAGGIILLAAVVTNIILSFIFQKPINPWGWFLRGLLASTALAASCSNLDWMSLKEKNRLLR